ncbi:MAG: hypothetical protein JSW00_04435 [Thermoplasmata archaeon]|nr:MAG: hypothetical protein JSW00_04435 [Thermoplasmata archaeon]
MSVKISKWSLLGPSFVIIGMSLGLLTKYGVEDVYTHILHIGQFIVIILTLTAMNAIYIRLYKTCNEKKIDTAENI